jgi:type II secretory pathway pseudopilin PulG
MPGFLRARRQRQAERKSQAAQAAQAAQEALAREKQQIQQVLAGIPKEMMDSKDMVIILNARGTVLLNMAFRGHPNQKSIVALASLAKTL